VGPAILLLLASLLVVLIVGFWTLTAGVRKLNASVTAGCEELRSLRLKSRARVATARFDGDSELAVLRRLGRESTAKRVVFGGEDESEQKKGLRRRWGQEAENGGNDSDDRLQQGR
jgi:hypothetical protein